MMWATKRKVFPSKFFFTKTPSPVLPKDILFTKGNHFTLLLVNQSSRIYWKLSLLISQSHKIFMFVGLRNESFVLEISSVGKNWHVIESSKKNTQGNIFNIFLLLPSGLAKIKEMTLLVYLFLNSGRFSC